MDVRVYNTMSRSVELFKPISEDCVGMYTCGPTVYNYAHIGNLRTFLFEDLLKRTLRYAGYKVRHVMNITDVGHLTGDGDDGEDKVEKMAHKTGKSVWEIADFYTKAFFRDYDALGIIRPDVVCKATDHIKDMIALIEKLEKGGHTYTSGGNVYFDISSIPDYGKLARLKLDSMQDATRSDVCLDGNKKNPKDFVLWFTNSKFGKQDMMWPSPWGEGFPGWHIECSAMSMKYLGEHFDIHCGGIDAISVHHTNEIAQSEAATGKKWVDYWVHGEFLLDERGKMSKSNGEFLTLSTLEARGYDPMDYRYFCLGGNYRSQLKFSYPAMDSAKEARNGIVSRLSDILQRGGKAVPIESEEAKARQGEFASHVCDDLNSPRGLADLWGVLKDPNLSDDEKYSLALDYDKVFGLGLDRVTARKTEEVVPIDGKVASLLEARAEAKKAKDWAKADNVRDELSQMGYVVKDTPQGPVVTKKK